MKTNLYDSARMILANHLEQAKGRKTPERFAILEAVYGFSSYFSIQDLGERLKEMNFPVSRATLYNTIKLLMSLRLVVSLRLENGVRYKACYADGKCLQVCTVCGKVKEIKLQEMSELFDNIHLKRFRKDSFTAYVYGTCSTCQAMMTRQKKKEKHK